MRVLILCTGNSCRSIIAEALIDRYIDGVDAYSAGVAPIGEVNPYAKRVLEANGIWRDKYHSKDIDSIEGIDFDLVVTVCDSAREQCPLFSRQTPQVHIGFSDPDGKEYSAFEDTYRDIKDRLLPQVKNILKVSQSDV